MAFPSLLLVTRHVGNLAFCLVPYFILFYLLAVAAVIKGNDEATRDVQSSTGHVKKIIKIRYVYISTQLHVMLI
jgi:hypothetical protein